MRDDGLTPDVIKKLEEKLTQQGRTLECVDPRNRSGHPPDWVISFADGSKHYVCGHDRESLLPLATMLLEPVPIPLAGDVCPYCAGRACSSCNYTGKRP